MDDPRQETNELKRQTSEVRRSTRSVEQSMGRFADSADRRTELAGDRTLLSAERTYAAWMRTALAALWAQVAPGAKALGVLPMEVLQTAFWQLDPARTIAKYAAFATMPVPMTEANQLGVPERRLKRMTPPCCARRRTPTRRS